MKIYWDLFYNTNMSLKIQKKSSHLRHLISPTSNLTFVIHALIVGQSDKKLANIP